MIQNNLPYQNTYNVSRDVEKSRKKERNMKKEHANLCILNLIQGTKELNEINFCHNLLESRFRQIMGRHLHKYQKALQPYKHIMITHEFLASKAYLGADYVRKIVPANRDKKCKQVNFISRLYQEYLRENCLYREKCLF